MNKQTTNNSDTTDNEDELLASSQETLTGSSHGTETCADEITSKPSGSIASTSHSTPVLPKPNNTAKPSGSNASHSNANRSKKKSSGVLRKNQFLHASFILSKIAKNEAEGTCHERDAEDKIKYQKVIDDYNNLLTKKEKAVKRDRSQEETLPSQKKSKLDGNVKKKKATSLRAAQPPTLSEVVRDDLQVAVVDELSTNSKGLLSVWSSIEAKLSEMVFTYTLSTSEGPYPSFDSGEMLRGYRVIKCEDAFSRDFLRDSIAKVSNDWEGLKLKLIPAKEIPRQPKARIWLPLMGIKPSGLELIRGLQRLNPLVPMHDWVVIKAEEPQKTSTSYLLRITEESRGALEKADYKLRFGIRHAKIKILQDQGPDTDKVDESAKISAVVDGSVVLGAAGPSTN